MNYFVTGSTGFLGKAIAAALRNRGDRVWTGSRQDLAKVDDLSGWDIVIHAAAEIYDTKKMFESNVLLTEKLIHMAEMDNVQFFVYLGSSSEYGRWDIPLREDLPLHPETPYEITKSCGSLLCAKSSLRSLIIRPFSVYGPGEPVHRFIPKIYESLTTGKELTITPGNHDFIFIDDFVDGVLRVTDAELDGCAAGYCHVANLGSGIQYSNTEVVETFERVLNKVASKKFTSELGRPFDTNNWVCDTSYVEKVYGFKAETTLEEGLRKDANYRANL